MIKIKNYHIYPIMYHYVHDKGYFNFKKLNIKSFKNQINFFKKKGNILNYDEFINIIKTKKIPKKPSFLLTFDDGYKDNVNNILPILLKEKIKGFFYPPVKIFKKELLDVNKIHIILSKNKNIKKLLETVEIKLGNEYNQILKKYKILFKTRYDDPYTLLFKRLFQYAIPKKKRMILLNEIFCKYIDMNESNIVKKIYINLNDLRSLKNEGMHIGIHGYDHLWWNEITTKEINDEILKSKKFFLSKKIKADSVCYPYGGYNYKVTKIVRDNKFKFAFTTNPISINKKVKKFEIGRFDTNDFK